MSWREAIKSRSESGVPLMGRFREARFIVPDSDLTIGRRHEVHEYPLRDLPYVEDLGRKARQFTIEVFVDATLAGDYLAARDALIAAIEAPGPGSLVHPWYGTLTVSITEAIVRESTREGGRATFRLTCVESGELTFPTGGADTGAGVAQAAEAVEVIALQEFTEQYEVSDLPPAMLDELADAVGGITSAISEALSGPYKALSDLTGGALESLQNVVRQVTRIEGAIDRAILDAVSGVSNLTSAVSSMIRVPFNVGAAILGSVQRISALFGDPGRVLRLYSGPLFRSLFGGSSSGNSGGSVGARGGLPAPLTPRGVQQVRAYQAAVRLARRAALAEGGKSLALALTAQTADQPLTRQEAEQARDLLFAALDEELESVDEVTGEPIDDRAYASLTALRAAVAEDVRVRGARLPELTTYRTTATLPALVVAHQLYGDARRAEEIVHRNKIAHPGFVPGGELLEVLRDV